jgi:hypothetical protein
MLTDTETANYQNHAPSKDKIIPQEYRFYLLRK